SSGLSAYRDGKWTIYQEADGLPSDYVNDYFRDSQGRQFVLTSKGLAQKEGNRWIRPLEEKQLLGYDQFFWSIAEVPSVGVMAASTEAFFVLHNGQWSRFAKTNLRMTHPKIISTAAGELIAVTNFPPHRFLAWQGSRFKEMSQPIHSLGTVEFLKEAPDGSIWCVGYNLCFRWGRKNREWNEYTNLPPPRLIDSAGGVWFVGNDSAVRFDGNNWETIPGIHGTIALGREDEIWAWSGAGIVRYSSEGVKRYSETETGIAKPVGYQLDEQGNSWFHGTNSGGRNVVSWFNASGWHPESFDALQGVYSYRANLIQQAAFGTLFIGDADRIFF
ncbi:MAG: hypothetical protein O7C75_17435, partial [Verrucomicrobia bacterium]|nr:hypothetical protein [Verrucomicrobiota bacterium]